MPALASLEASVGPGTTTAAETDVRSLSEGGLRTRSLVEFLMVGGATLVLLPLAWILRATLGLDESELAVGFLMFHAAHLINDPHFSVTYVLFYKNVRERALGSVWRPSQRARYLIAGFFVPLALAVWGVSAIQTGSAASLGLMIQLMFFLVGWHYVKQGFGVLSVLSLRRGVRFSKFERRVILAHCISGWLYARASPFDPGTEAEEKGVLYTSLPHPPELLWLTLAAFALSSVALVYVLGQKWRREGSLPLSPLLGLLVTVWLWVVFSDLDPLLIYMIPALHSLQYLYFVWLLKGNQAKAEQGPPLFQRSESARLTALAFSAVALGWFLFHGFPDFLDTAFTARATANSALGSTPYFAALFAFVNIHHYFMDSVIWRRDNPETRYLMDSTSC